MSIFSTQAFSETSFSDLGQVILEGSATLIGTARSEARIVLERRPSGGSYAEVDGTTSITYNRQEFQDATTASISILQSVTSGDTYRVRVSRNSGSSVLQVVSNQARFNFFKID